MSSRSFRRRNNRRRQRPSTGADAAGQNPTGQPADRPPQHGRPQKAAPAGTPKGGGQRREGMQGQGGRGSPARRAEPRPEPPTPVVFPDCPLCGKSVRELASALTHRASGQPAHFDCIMRELRDSNEIGPQEQLCYLGGGSFGIVELRPQGAPSRFVIRKRIQYEEKETPQEWKKQLQVFC